MLQFSAQASAAMLLFIYARIWSPRQVRASYDATRTTGGRRGHEAAVPDRCRLHARAARGDSCDHQHHRRCRARVDRDREPEWEPRGAPPQAAWTALASRAAAHVARMRAAAYRVHAAHVGGSLGCHVGFAGATWPTLARLPELAPTALQADAGRGA
eukprot:scaffold1983_cov376-Prasinococcus_capsulatus_cf.AAC.9